VTIGIEPTFPSSAFGYLHLGDPIPGYGGGFRVQSFVEKPSEVVARRYVNSGEHKWNAGMFVVRPSVLLDLLAGSDPEFADRLRALAAAPETIGEVWPTLPKIAVDHAVAEPAADAGRVAAGPASFGWDDIGDFDSLAALLGAGTARAPRSVPVVLGDEELVISVHSTGLVVPGSGKPIAVVGVDDVVVVDTPDALLVTTRSRAQDVKAVVNALKGSGHAELT
jgi:mannose-1-phosphate guanylyltransferase